MQRRIVMLGTSPATRGGISAVVTVYRAEGLFDRWPIVYLTTHRDVGWLANVFVAGAALLRFVVLVAARQVAAVHVHTASRRSFWRKATFMLCAWCAGRPYILHLHGGAFIGFYEQECGALRRRAVRFLFDRAACVLVLSEHWRAWVCSISGNCAVHVLPNPVRVQVPLRNPASDPRVLFLGRIERAKGVFDLVQAVAMLKSRFPALTLDCAGAGDFEALRRHAQDCGVDGRLRHHGWVGPEARAALLAEATLLALPSYREGLPMSLLEAMAAGCPIVACAVGGVPDAVRDGVDGLLVPAGDPRALAAALERLLGDAALRARLASSARRIIAARFSASSVVAQLEAIYRGLGIDPSKLAQAQAWTH